LARITLFAPQDSFFGVLKQNLAYSCGALRFYAPLGLTTVLSHLSRFAIFDRMKYLLTIIATVAIVSMPFWMHAQTEDIWFDEREQPWEMKSFLIAASSPDYATARKIAIAAAEILQLQLEIDITSPNDSIGLTASKEICEEECFGYPCYVPRGRWDDSVYVSIEYSDAYSGFTKGLYIVILANGSRDAEYLKPLLARARTYFSDAYIKTTEVYLGCMH
jgi:hypothetical protein